MRSGHFLEALASGRKSISSNSPVFDGPQAVELN
jgi:hypothetical protein